ncbi:MAG: TspO/MBR family protein [Lachnospiraceae bacterium]
MKIKKDELAIAILLPLAVGSVASYLTTNAMGIYGSLSKPSLSPPGWMFPVVWTVLYILMGIASYRIYQQGIEDLDVKKAITFYLISLGINFLWPVLFFNYSLYLVSFFLLLLLIGVLIYVIRLFKKLDPIAAYFMIPYLIWTIFAAYLNLMVYFLNK